VDTDALHDLYSNVGFPEQSRITKEIFREHIDEWWERAFKMNITTASRKFTYSICTDGMSVSVNLKRKVPPYNGINNYGFENWGTNQARYVPMEIEEGDRVVGVDPGRRDLFVAVGGETKEDVTSCSTREYYALAGFAKTRKKREFWLTNAPDGLQQVIRGI